MYTNALTFTFVGILLIYWDQLHTGCCLFTRRCMCWCVWMNCHFFYEVQCILRVVLNIFFGTIFKCNNKRAHALYRLQSLTQVWLLLFPAHNGMCVTECKLDHHQGCFFLRRGQLTPLTYLVCYSPPVSTPDLRRRDLAWYWFFSFFFFLSFLIWTRYICFLISGKWPFGVSFEAFRSANIRGASVIPHFCICTFFCSNIIWGFTFVVVAQS